MSTEAAVKRQRSEKASRSCVHSQYESDGVLTSCDDATFLPFFFLLPLNA